MRLYMFYHLKISMAIFLYNKKAKDLNGDFYDKKFYCQNYA